MIAYEPVWAIGTGALPRGADANAVVAQNIRVPLSKLFGEVVAQGIRVQYGGSVTPANIDRVHGQPEIDGALVGGASLKVAGLFGHYQRDGAGEVSEASPVTGAFEIDSYDNKKAPAGRFAGPSCF